MVTTSRDAPDGPQVDEARRIAEAVGGRFLPRDDRPLSFFYRYGFPVIVLGGQGMRVHTPEGEIFYHPGMGHSRIRRLLRGGSDPMADAMALSPGDAVLDCTLGLGSDAIVAAHLVGEEGTVVGWESVPVLAELVRRGMQAYDAEHPAVAAAIRRVKVVCADHRAALPRLPPQSFDVVYFDPMFREPVYESSHFTALRRLTDSRPLDAASVAAARRVARKRVVIKERKDSPVFADLGVERIIGARRSRIAYGILEAEPEVGG